MPHRVIHLHPAAPAQPAAGERCNGCGVCCSYAPCPLGMLISWRMRGACRALTWSGASALYRCGALCEPARYLPWLPARVARFLVRRWIAAARGCDAELGTA